METPQRTGAQTPGRNERRMGPNAASSIQISPDLPEEERERLLKRMELAEIPSSVVLAFRSRECIVMSPMIFAIDRAVNRIKYGAGLQIRMEETRKYMQETEAFVSRLENLVNELEGGNYYNARNDQYEDPMIKKLDAARRFASVFTPKTTEGRRISQAIKHLDPLILNIKNNCQDFSRFEQVTNDTLQIIITFHTLTEKLSRAAKTDYRPSKHIFDLMEHSGTRESDSDDGQ